MWFPKENKKGEVLKVEATHEKLMKFIMDKSTAYGKYILEKSEL